MAISDRPNQKTSRNTQVPFLEEGLGKVLQVLRLTHNIRLISIHSSSIIPFMNPEVEQFYKTISPWNEELNLLRLLVSETELVEEFKWKQPCYTLNGANVVIVSGFKEYCSLNFFKGSLFNDPENLLVSPGENTQSGRQLRFNSVQEIAEKQTIIKAYLDEAIRVEKAGLKVEYKGVEEYDIPEELQSTFDDFPDFKDAFYSLTAGRQKAYILHFSGAKQSSTRQSRIDKYIPRILKGKGFHDCVCGHSKRMPTCDGSHKHFPKVEL